jgi:hypothetical protein
MNAKTSRISLSSFALTIALLFVGATSALGQSTATLQGTITDAKGAVLPNATVTVRNQATSIERKTQTDSSGSYQIAALPVGQYTVEVQAQGFRTESVSNLSIEVARTVVQDFQLEIGSFEQKVNITADTQVIETATTSVGQVINQ